jgi:hypothetical protein
MQRAATRRSDATAYIITKVRFCQALQSRSLSPFVTPLSPNASNAFNAAWLNYLGQAAIAPTPGRARAEHEAGLGPATAAVADPQEEETEHQEGR